MDDVRLSALLVLHDYEPAEVDRLVWAFGPRRWWAEADCWMAPIEAAFDYRGERVDARLGWEPQDDNGIKLSD